jgi:hypothetical protein
MLSTVCIGLVGQAPHWPQYRQCFGGQEIMPDNWVHPVSTSPYSFAMDEVAVRENFRTHLGISFLKAVPCCIALVARLMAMHQLVGILACAVTRTSLKQPLKSSIIARSY